MVISRRDFIKVGLGGVGYFSTAGLVPNWIIRSAQAIEDVSGEGRILVIVQLEGGNDGINTVIPHTDPLYSPVDRPTLYVPPAQAISVDALNSFHPALADLVPWFDSGRIAVIQNVGYPNPDLSHFISTDYWEQGRAPAGPDVGTPSSAISCFRIRSAMRHAVLYVTPSSRSNCFAEIPQRVLAIRYIA